jgi:hypothetical protein
MATPEKCFMSCSSPNIDKKQDLMDVLILENKQYNKSS